MSDWMVWSAWYAAGILTMAVWHGVHVWAEGRNNRENEKVQFWPPYYTSTDDVDREQ